jgi:phosphodiesterase/alkaline phosphatase D-like protein
MMGRPKKERAPPPQGANTFARWSDGGTQQHDVTIGTTATTYTASFNAASDTRPPTISAIRVTGVSGSRATINWATDEPSDSQVEYGTSPTFGSSSALDPAKVASHSVRLTGLSPNATYYYRVKSTDAAGNLAVSGPYTFKTK